MDGGPAAEKTIEKITRERMTKIAEIQEDRNKVSSKNGSEFRGEVSSIVPNIEKVEIDTDTAGPAEEKNRRTFQDEEKTQRLESVYETLFGEGGFEILRDQEAEAVHDPAKMGSLSYEGTKEKLHNFGLLEDNEITQTGSLIYENWSGIEEYLSSQERVEDIKEEIGEMGMPGFLRLSGVDVEDADSYLRNKSRFENQWAREHDGTVELYMITDALYSGKENDGETLRLLEDVKKGEVDHPEGYEEIGIRGINSKKESALNLDGEKIYGKVLADYMSF
jgi:hypothetical protein